MAKVMMSEITSELTPEELQEIEAASLRPVTYDEDSPEMTAEMLKQFHGFNTIPISVSPASMKKAKAFGKNYLGILARLLELAINDPDMVKKCV